MVITTNFDRLVERALQEIGIDPLVAASARDAKAAPPHAVRCVVVKVHGDRASPDLRNTLAELASYDDDLREYLERLLDEHGLVVCGWSGDWDPALRELVQTHESSLLATFWAHRDEPSQRAADVIKSRIAHPMAIAYADTFFETHASQVQALEELAAVRPDSADVGRAWHRTLGC